MKKLFYILSCLIACASALADNTEVVRNKQIRWNGNNVITSVKTGYADYLKKLNDAAAQYYSRGDYDLGTESADEDYDYALADRDKLIKTLLGKNTFSLDDAFMACINNRVVTPNSVCKKVVSNLMRVASKAEGNNSANGALTGNQGGVVVTQKGQNCKLMQLKYVGMQQPNDDEFLYQNAAGMNSGFGYECDSDTSACMNGDIIYFDRGAVFKGKQLDSRKKFVCRSDYAGDRWEEVGASAAAGTNGAPAGNQGGVVVTQKGQNCKPMKINYVGTQRKTDNEFLYQNAAGMNSGFGYECDSGTSACMNGDIISFDKGVFFVGKQLNRRIKFICKSDYAGDRWEEVGASAAAGTNGAPAGNQSGVIVTQKGQNCKPMKINYVGTQRKTDNEFLYQNAAGMNSGFGYECDSGTSACMNGDRISFDKGAFIAGKQLSGNIEFVCNAGLMGDAWQRIK